MSGTREGRFQQPFVKSNKSNFLEAEAIAEAVDRQNMRFVPIKTDDQLDLQAIASHEREAELGFSLLYKEAKNDGL